MKYNEYTIIDREILSKWADTLNPSFIGELEPLVGGQSKKPKAL